MKIERTGDPVFDRMLDERTKAIADSRAILERYADGAEMPADEEAAYKRANHAIDRLSERINEMREQKENNEAFATAFRSYGWRQWSAVTRSSPFEIRNDLRAGEAVKGRAMTVRLPDVEKRDLLVGTSNKGAELVPTTLVAQMYERFVADSAILTAEPTIFRTEAGEPMKLPRAPSKPHLCFRRVRPQPSAGLIGPPLDFSETPGDQHKRFRGGRRVGFPPRGAGPRRRGPAAVPTCREQPLTPR